LSRKEAPVVTAEPRIDYLNWAIGRPCGLTVDSARGAVDVVALFKEHRVTGRALYRALAEKPRWMTGAEIKSLEVEQQGNKAFLAQQGVALRQLRECYLTRGEPILIIKGTGVYVHTARDYALRRTNDVDLMLLEPDETVELFKRNGLEEYKNGLPHEMMNVLLAGVEIDLHSHYPVWSFDEDVGRTSVETTGDIEIRKHYGRLKVGKLLTRSVMKGAHATNLYGVPGVFLSDPAAAVLIISSHAFRDFVSMSSVPVRTKPPIRYADLADVIDLLRLPTFDADRFLSLVAETSAHDTVRWMAGVLVTYTDEHGLAELLQKADGYATREPGLSDGLPNATPQAVWPGFWETFADRPGSEVCEHVPTCELVERLGGGVLRMAQDREITLHCADIGENSGLPKPTTVHVGGSGAVPFEMRLLQGQNKLHVMLGAVAMAPCASRAVHIEINGEGFEWRWKTGSGHRYWEKSDHLADPEIAWRQENGTYNLSVSFDLPEREEKTSAIVASVGEFDDDREITRGTMVPLKLSLE
jgi:Uncharacterised nucleotidyltransferase